MASFNQQGKMSDETASYFHYAYSCDLTANLSLKIGSLEGALPRPDYEQGGRPSLTLSSFNS